MKELRWGYKNAADFGWKSGSGRIIAEYFDILKKIWDGSPALLSAVTSQETSQNKEKSASDSETEELEQQPEKCDQNKIEERKKTE